MSTKNLIVRKERRQFHGTFGKLKYRELRSRFKRLFAKAGE